MNRLDLSMLEPRSIRKDDVQLHHELVDSAACSDDLSMVRFPLPDVDEVRRYGF